MATDMTKTKLELTNDQRIFLKQAMQNYVKQNERAQRQAMDRGLIETGRSYDSYLHQLKQVLIML